MIEEIDTRTRIGENEDNRKKKGRSRIREKWF